jgi:hypothetical protein
MDDTARESHEIRDAQARQARYAVTVLVVFLGLVAYTIALVALVRVWGMGSVYDEGMAGVPRFMERVFGYVIAIGVLGLMLSVLASCWYWTNKKVWVMLLIVGLCLMGLAQFTTPGLSGGKYGDEFMRGFAERFKSRPLDLKETRKWAAQSAHSGAVPGIYQMQMLLPKLPMCADRGHNQADTVVFYWAGIWETWGVAVGPEDMKSADGIVRDVTSRKVEPGVFVIFQSH